MEYDLNRAHPAYQRLLPTGFDRLIATHPRAKLDRVELFDPEPEDLSIGNVDETGVVKLSARWFGQDPSALQRAALAEPKFHGPLTKQPEQAIAHEFGHCLLDGLGKDAQKRNLECWEKATRDPSLAPGPYALAAGGNEYFSELFAAKELGVITTAQRAVLDHILGESGHAYDREFSEVDHPRGQPKNAGQFAKASGHGASGRTHESGSPLPEHIAKLRLPPAWTDVRYSLDPDAALLAVGRDAKGREQRVYSSRFSHEMAEAKFRRIETLDRKFDAIREQNEAARSEPRTRDVADALALIMSTGIRPGSEEDTKAAKRAYGATTLEGRHVEETPEGVTLRFTGKKGVDLAIPVDDPEIARMLATRARAVGPDGKLFPQASASRLLAHTHSLDGGNFKTKDFRTLLGTRLAQHEVATSSPPKDEKSYRASVMAVAKRVAQRLGNTPTMALQAYIAPEVFGSWRLAAHAA